MVAKGDSLNPDCHCGQLERRTARVALGKLIALLALAAIARAASGAEIVERCGRGPSPASPDFAAYVEENKRVREELGYEPVCDELLAAMSPSRFAHEPLPAARHKLGFQPIPLDGSLFARYRPLGATPDFAGGPLGASALRRYFAGERDEAIELFEFDTSLGGGVFTLDTSPQAETIKGHAARIAIFQSKTGRAVSVLSWEENRRYIEIRVNRNIRQHGYADLIRLAQSLPAPVPAQPNAPVSTRDELPPPFGRGVQFPAVPDFASHPRSPQ